jgi:hypothetical protein
LFDCRWDLPGSPLESSICFEFLASVFFRTAGISFLSDFVYGRDVSGCEVSSVAGVRAIDKEMSGRLADRFVPLLDRQTTSIGS